MKTPINFAFLVVISFFVQANPAMSQGSPTKDKRIPIGPSKPADDNLPKAISFPEPVYPNNFAPTYLHGEMRLYINVNKEGKVSVFDSFGPNSPCSNLADPETKAIRQAVIEATEKAVFEVPMKDGKPTEKSLMIKFDLMPKDKPSDGSQAKLVQGGVINGKALNLPKPSYPLKARSERASGTVSVHVLIAEDGKIISAAAVDGHRLLREASVETACKARYSPTTLAGRPVKVSGIIMYNFIP